MGIGERQNKNAFKPKRILPKKFRDDPYADDPVINEDELKEGMFSLVNRGLIPRDADLSPAFERGGQSLMTQKSVI